MRSTNIDWVRSQARQFGEVSRNECLKNYISRLAPVIQVLEKEGYVFSAGYRKTPAGRDYVYTLVDTPKRKIVVHDIVDGVAVPRVVIKEL